MNRIATLFMATGAAAALVGMGWGIQMSATHDHALSPAHAHLNLIGFVVMSIYGVYYALSATAAASRLAWVHYGVSIVAVISIVPGIVLAITGQGEGLAKIGSLAALGSMAIFLATVFRHGIESIGTER